MTLYTKKNCCQCKMVHTLMDKKKIKYDEYPIDEDKQSDLDKMKELGIDGTPALEVDGRIIRGQELMKFINGVN